MPEISVIGMSMTNQRFINRLPWIKVDPGLFTINAFVSKLKKVHLNRICYSEYSSWVGKKRAKRYVLRLSCVYVLMFALLTGITYEFDLAKQQNRNRK